MSRCEVDCCDMLAEFYDGMGNKICRSCMEQEVHDYGYEPEDYEQIKEDD